MTCSNSLLPDLFADVYIWVIHTKYCCVCLLHIPPGFWCWWRRLFLLLLLGIWEKGISFSIQNMALDLMTNLWFLVSTETYDSFLFHEKRQERLRRGGKVNDLDVVYLASLT